jgi:hypothetical protein
MGRPLLSYREAAAPWDVLTEAVPVRDYPEGSALNLARAVLLGVEPSKVPQLLDFLRAYRGRERRGNSLITGGALSWGWKSSLAAETGFDHHGDFSGVFAGPHHAHGQLSGVGSDDHHARDHATRHDPLGADALSTAYFRTDGSLGLAGNFLPDGDASRDLGSASYRWRHAHFAGNVFFDGYINPPATGLTCYWDDTRDIGNASYRWRDFYLSRDLYLSLLTTHGDIMFRGAAKMARLAPGVSGQFLKTQGAGADPVWATPATGFSSKSKYHSRNFATAAGDVSYTGYGFQPTALRCFATYYYGGNLAMSGGSSDSAKGAACNYSRGNGYVAGGLPFFISIYAAAANYQWATIKSYDSDGFTLTWAENKGGYTGFIYFSVLALG